MFHYFLFASAYYIKSLVTGNYLGIDENRDPIMSKIDKVIDIELEGTTSSDWVKFNSKDFGYLAIVKNTLQFSKEPTLFKILYSFNGGFLISHNSQCLTEDTKRSNNSKLEMMGCRNKSNKFLILKNSSLSTGEEIKLKFLGNLFKINKKILTEIAYGNIDSAEIILRMERYIVPESKDIEDSKQLIRRDFVKINEF